MAKLTVRAVEKIIKSRTPGTTGDGQGLYLQIARNGSASWLYRFQLRGKRRNMGLGACDIVSLAEARIRAADARKMVADGTDPIEATKAMERSSRANAQRVAAKNITFSDLAADYIATHKAGWKNAKHAKQWENTIKTYALPHIGKMIPADISTADVLKVLKPIWLVKPETASRVRNRIELILDAAKAQELREGENPARWRGHLDKLLPKREKVQAVKHHAALPWPELPIFMANLAQRKGTSFRAMEMTILTACRTSEVLNAKWEEIDLQARVWTIPADRMKMGKEHRVPLTDALLQLLGTLPRLENNPHLFPGMREGKPLSNMAMLMGLNHMGRKDLTVHGFRSTFRDWASESTPHPNFVVEMALAHAVGSAVEAAYRRGDLFDKRRKLMDDWSKYCLLSNKSASKQIISKNLQFNS